MNIYRANTSALIAEHLTEWAKCANGGTLRIPVLVGEDGAATVQVRKLQDAYAEVRRIVVRAPISSNRYMVAVFSNGAWTYQVRRKTPAPQLYAPVVSDNVALLPLATTPTVAALRRAVVVAYPSEGAFLDWLAYKSPHGWVVDSVHDLTDAQARLILAGFEVGHQ